MDEVARGITKADVCRCQGTLEHDIFRRDTTPEYTMDDSRRAHSLATVPVRCRVSETESQRRARGKEREALSPGYSEGQSPDVRRSTVQPIKAERS